MIDVYFWPTGNGKKITIMLEETGLQYRILPVNINKGDQFTAEFLAISPNNKMPAIVETAAWPCSNRAPSCSTSRKKPGNSCPRTPPESTGCCNGCTGRWAASGPWPARRITS